MGRDVDTLAMVSPLCSGQGLELLISELFSTLCMSNRLSFFRRGSVTEDGSLPGGSALGHHSKCPGTPCVQPWSLLSQLPWCRGSPLEVPQGLSDRCPGHHVTDCLLSRCTLTFCVPEPEKRTRCELWWIKAASCCTDVPQERAGRTGRALLPRPSREAGVLRSHGAL